MVVAMAKHGLMCSCRRCQKAATDYVLKPERREENSRTGGVTGAVVSGAITLAGAYGDVTSVPQSGDAPLRDEAKTFVQEERTKQARILRRGTIFKGRQRGGSSKS
jgi:hypothetical protein